ncbi:tautomerase family protein [Vibrio navarrensis]|uniref:tautomerase family protein n=1 Tax=Vibrio navarrensis TaxID=29495 RepID=UPI0029C01C60|nr:tautomerase family protein [Vibrio navarrensis]
MKASAKKSNHTEQLLIWREKRPYINVKTTSAGVTKEQKQGNTKGCTQLMIDVFNKETVKTFVVMDEVHKDF